MNDFLKRRSGWAAHLPSKRRRKDAQALRFEGYSMTQRVTIAKAARGRAGVAVLAGAMALASALPAMAQSSASNTAQDRSGYYYDACKRDQTQRGTVGAVLGGGAGAV